MSAGYNSMLVTSHNIVPIQHPYVRKVNINENLLKIDDRILEIVKMKLLIEVKK